MSADAQASPIAHIRIRPLDLAPIFLAYLLGILLAGLLILHMLMLVIPQQPVYIQSPAEAQAWLYSASVSAPWVRQAARLGLTTLARSPLYRGVLLLLIALMPLHTLYALYVAFWPRPARSVPPLSPQAVERGRFEHVPKPLAQVQDMVLARLAPLTVVAEAHPSYQEARFFARGGMKAIWGTLIFLGGVFVFALSVYRAAVFGWETPPTIVAPGDSWDVGHRSGIRVSLLAEEEAGAYAGDLFLIQVQGRASEGQVYTIPEGGRVSLGAVEIRHLASPPGVRLQATTRTGAPIPLVTPDGQAGRDVVLVFPQSGDERTALIPTYGLQVRVVGYSALPERGFPGRVFLVQVLGEDETPLLSEFITESKTLELQGITLQIVVVRHALVQAVYRPGRLGRWVGLVLALLGVGVALLGGPFRRVWVQLYSHGRGTIVQVWEDRYNLGWHR